MPKFFSVLVLAVSIFFVNSFAQPDLYHKSTVNTQQIDGTAALLYDQTAGGATGGGYASQDF